MGNKRDRKISDACVKTDNWVDVMRTWRSNIKQCQTKMIFSISKHSKRKVKGMDTQAIGKLCGGAQILMTESSMVVWTSNEPGGGAGISAQKLTMYRSMGNVMESLLTRR